MSANSSWAPENCLTSSRSLLVLIAFSITNILLMLPVCSAVLCLGVWRWRRQCVSTAAVSHCDVFTFQMAAMELIGLLGWVVFYAGIGTGVLGVVTRGLCMFFSTWCVKIHFHTLTCVERYLAVVHPVTYRGLKSRGRIRIRKLCCGCLWLLCLLQGALAGQTLITVSLELYVIFVCLALTIIWFCCASVVRALRRPPPGEVGRGRSDQAKRRALVTVATIMGSLWPSLVGMLVCISLAKSGALSDGCEARVAAVWFSLPSSLVLPLLGLNRAGKLPGCK